MLKTGSGYALKKRKLLKKIVYPLFKSQGELPRVRN